MTKLILKSNANETIKNQLHEQTNTAIYKTLENAVNNGYKVQFGSNMQIYVQRIAHLLSDQSLTIKMIHNTYLGACDFIEKVLNNPNLGKMLRNIEVNDSGNDIKHSVKNVNLDIKECLHQYNRIIDGFVNTLKLPAFKICKIEYNKQSTPLFNESKKIKYEVINNIKFSISLSDKFTVDQYNKTLNTEVIVSWPEVKNDNSLSLIVENLKTKTQYGKIDKIILDNAGSKRIKISIPKRDLNKNTISIVAHIVAYTKEPYSYTTGILFWKETHRTSYDKNVGSKDIVLSYTYLKK